jgi:T-complex protein 1 subunit beta
MIGEDKLLHFSGVKLGEACTIVLRGASTHILEEADRCGRRKWQPSSQAGTCPWDLSRMGLLLHLKHPTPFLPRAGPLRSLHDALCVLSETVKDSRVVYGGGWPEMRMARAVEEAAKTTPGGCTWG